MNALEYVPVPAFEDNYIWLVSDGHHAVVVDPGEAAPVRAYLAKQGWQLSAILLTHHHQDHVGGVADLLNGQAVPVYGPAGESIEHLTYRLKSGDHVSIAAPALELSVLDVPGHTSGHIAYFQAADPGGTPHVFCGDTLFACGCGRLFEGTPAQMLKSLDELAALPGATQVHCAHEYTLSNIRFALACPRTAGRSRTQTACRRKTHGVFRRDRPPCRPCPRRSSTRGRSTRFCGQTVRQSRLRSPNSCMKRRPIV
jgi:hydroxyacylglutathione hydrolase